MRAPDFLFLRRLLPIPGLFLKVGCLLLLRASYSQAEYLEATFDSFEEPAFYTVTAETNVSLPRVVFRYYVPLKALQIRKRDLKSLIQTLKDSYDSDSFNQRPLVRDLLNRVNLRLEFRRGTEIIATCKAPNRYVQFVSNFDDEGNEEWALETVYSAQIPIKNPRAYERKICLDPITQKPIVPALQDSDRAVLIQKKSSILGDEEFFPCDTSSQCEREFD